MHELLKLLQPIRAQLKSFWKASISCSCSVLWLWLCWEYCWSRCVYLKHGGSVQPTTRNEFPSSLFNLSHRCFTYCPCCLATSQPQWKNLCAFFPLSGWGRQEKVRKREQETVYTPPLHSLPTKHGVPEVNKKCPECWKPEECPKLIHTLNVIIFNDVIKYLTL